MRERWMALCQPFDATIAGAAYDELAARYAEPHRAYHTLVHISHVLDVIDELSNGAGDEADPERFAGWWHDAVYDPRRGDNEEMSASWAANWLGRMGAPRSLVGEVQRLVRLTAGHLLGDPAGDRAAAVLIDADLSVLGADPAAYERYRAGVRLEYGWLSDADWAAGRRSVLENFLARPRLFVTDQLYRRLEVPARANLTAELAALA